MIETGQTRVIGPVEWAVRHDHLIVLGAVVLVVVLALVYTVLGVGMGMSAIDMTRMVQSADAPRGMGKAVHWSMAYALLIFLMWWIMMIAMMTPSAAPMLSLYTALKRMGPDGGHAVSFSFLFLGGYLVAWAGFSVIASALQWVADIAGLTNGSMMMLNSSVFAGIVLVGAGVYQFSTFKDACLTHCRSPAYFLAKYRYPGAFGALRTGARHGLYCVGCCWALMALLFVGGIMNLYWIAGLAIYVLAEKTMPNGRLFSRLTGGVLIVSGGYLLVGAVLPIPN